MHNIDTGEVMLGMETKPLSVGVFLDAVNIQLAQNVVRVRGEVVSVSVYPRAVYFSIKDTENTNSVLSCVIFRYQYDMAGVALTAGVEVIVSGSPEVYKPSGRFNLKAQMLELSGDGALQKAYEALKKKLTTDGLLDKSRKRAVPKLPERIGLITSRDSAAIGDFRSNLGNYGLEVLLVHASVEGARAVPELLRALDMLSAQNIDVLVITRGGGSLESLQAFNNESLVRALADFKVPVIAGIGHERDETLATLVADAGVSTPTAAARAICTSWDGAREHLARNQKDLLALAGDMIEIAKQKLSSAPLTMAEFSRGIAQKFEVAQNRFLRSVTHYESALVAADTQFTQIAKQLSAKFAQIVEDSTRKLTQSEQLLNAHNPERLLAQGYSITRNQAGKIVRSVKDVALGDKLAISVKDGIIETMVDGGEE